jgi:signal transduction histidine kinase
MQGFRLSAPAALRIALGCFVVLGLFMYQRYEQSVAGSRIEAAAHDLERMTGELRALLAEAETNAHGFALTGAFQYLDRSNETATRVAVQMDRLQAVAGEDPDQQRRMNELEGAVAANINRLRQLLDLRRADRLEAARLLVAEDARATDDRVAFLIQTMVDDARAVTAARLARLQQTVDTTRWLMVGLFFVSCGLLLFAALRIRRELRRRLEAEFALRTAYAQGEERIRQRTNELVATNSLLRESEERYRQLVAQKDQALLERSEALAREQAARSDAELANRFRDRFLATVSHELRTPLNAIVGWTHLLRAGMLEDAGRAVEAIDRNAALQARLIDDLLDVSRMEQGRFSMAPVVVDVRGVVKAAVAAADPAARAKSISIACEAPEDPVTVLGDQHRLQQAVANLLANAVKYSRPGGTVSVAVDAVDGWATIDVEDSGEGIDAAFLPHVFQPFRQDATRPARAGLGLGLAIARGIVERHQGSISVESEGRDRGTHFHIRLPLGSPADLIVPEEELQAIEGRRGAIGADRPLVRPRGPSETPEAATPRFGASRRRRRARFQQPH